MNIKNPKPIAIIFAVTLFLMISDCFAGVIDNEEASAFAGFIQELVKGTQTAKQGVTCSFGSDEISKIIAGQEKKSFIDLSRDPGAFNSCRAVYVARGMEKGLMTEISKFHHNNIITIAIFDGFTESGGMIQVQMGRRSFELIVNAKEIKTANVRLNALVTSLVIN